MTTDRKEYMRKYRKHYKNTEHGLEVLRRNDRKHRKSPQRKAYMKEYRQRPYVKEYSQEYHKRHIMEPGVKERIYNYNHSDIGRQVRNSYGKTEKGKLSRMSERERNRLLLKIKILNILGRECVICGYKEIGALHIDHIHSDGYSERKRFRGHLAEWRYYRDHPEEAKKRLQILCANCNCQKEWNKLMSDQKHEILKYWFFI